MTELNIYPVQYRRHTTKKRQTTPSIPRWSPSLKKRDLNGNRPNETFASASTEHGSGPGLVPTMTITYYQSVSMIAHVHVAGMRSCKKGSITNNRTPGVLGGRLIKERNYCTDVGYDANHSPYQTACTVQKHLQVEYAIGKNTEYADDATIVPKVHLQTRSTILEVAHFR